MTDKKKTETEIMKALECCKSVIGGNCDDCPYICCNMFEESEAVKDTIDLIKDKNNQLKIYKKLLDKAEAEIDRLTEIEEAHHAQNGELRKEVERLTVNMNAFGLGMKRESERADTARAEAIKEFAEKIYRSCAMYGQKDKFNKTVFLKIVDQIAKEMGVEL